MAILVAKLITLFLHQELSLTLLMFAIGSSLFPDIDIVSPYIKNIFSRRKVINHRTFLHYPALYILPLVVISFYSATLAFIFTLCIFLHFVHDTFFLGWGVIWFWPLRSTRFKCFPDRDGKIVNVPLITWEEKEEKELIKRYHNPHWVRDFYFKPTIVAYIRPLSKPSLIIMHPSYKVKA